MALARRVAMVAGGGALAGGCAYLGLVTGAIPVDLGIGRRIRPLGPLELSIAAPREVVFAVIAAPYGERVPRAMREKVKVLERGDDMVLAAHFTPIRGRLRATTVETVRSVDRTGSTSGWCGAQCRMLWSHSSSQRMRTAAPC